MRPFRTLLLSCVTALLAACNLAPTYDPPHYLLPDSYHGSGAFGVANPQVPAALQSDWWTSFGDPQLNDLEARLGRQNPTLQAAAEEYSQARDLVAEAQSHFYPQLHSQALASANRESAHHLFSTGSAAKEESSNVIGAAASWEPDFWYALRNTARTQERLAEASAADLASARLSLQATLANAYIALRGLDAELVVLHRSIDAYEREVEVARLRTQGQIASGLDLARALSQLASARAQATETALQRGLIENAIAVLVGDLPTTFSIPPTPGFQWVPPAIPANVPSELLQRRPDIASAERQMAAANASIGVSRAAFYPNVTLNGIAGFESDGLNLVTLPNSFWSIGAGVMLPLFEGGLRRAELHRSWSRYAQTRDSYRATVLAAFQDVENGLSLTDRIAIERVEQSEASAQSVQALSIATTLYEGGLDNYLSVAVAQVQALSAQTAEVQICTRQMQAAVSLIRAMGGGWSSPPIGEQPIGEQRESGMARFEAPPAPK